jgi:hypothetical protein
MKNQGDFAGRVNADWAAAAQFHHPLQAINDQFETWALHGSDLGTIKIGPSSTKYEPKPVVF